MGRLTWTSRQTQHSHCTFWLVTHKAGLTPQMYSSVTAEYERSVRGTIRAPKHFLQPWEISRRSTATQEKRVWPWKDKRARGPWLRGKQMEPSICWEVSARTWFEQQKTGSHRGQEELATETPMKRAGQAGTSLDYSHQLCFLAENCTKLLLLDTASFQEWN